MATTDPGATEQADHETQVSKTIEVKFTADLIAFARHPASERIMALLIKRRWEPHQGCWAIPGGHVNTDEMERAIDAATREFREETGLVPPGYVKEIGVYHDPVRDARGRYITAAYATFFDHLAEPVASDDAEDAAWFPVDDLPEPVAFDHAQVIRDAMAAFVIPSNLW